jgi:hypothetical protein
MEMSHQELVPFSSTQFGVKTTFTDPTGTRMIELISGGYVDEVTESYDNLLVEGTREVAGAAATILVGTLLSVTVRVVLWQSPNTAEPCDLHALLASDLPRDQFDDVLTGVTITDTPQPHPTAQPVPPK